MLVYLLLLYIPTYSTPGPSTSNPGLLFPSVILSLFTTAAALIGPTSRERKPSKAPYLPVGVNDDSNIVPVLVGKCQSTYPCSAQ